MEGDGPTIFAHACKVGLEGIVSKRKDQRMHERFAGLVQEALRAAWPCKR